MRLIFRLILLLALAAAGTLVDYWSRQVFDGVPLMAYPETPENTGADTMVTVPANPTPFRRP